MDDAFPSRPRRQWRSSAASRSIPLSESACRALPVLRMRARPRAARGLSNSALSERCSGRVDLFSDRAPPADPGRASAARRHGQAAIPGLVRGAAARPARRQAAAGGVTDLLLLCPDALAADTLLRLRAVAPAAGPPIEPALRLAAWRAGIDQAPISALPHRLGLYDGDFDAIARESPDVALAYGMGQAMRYARPHALSGLLQMSQTFLRADAVRKRSGKGQARYTHEKALPLPAGWCWADLVAGTILEGTPWPGPSFADAQVPGAGSDDFDERPPEN